MMKPRAKLPTWRRIRLAPAGLVTAVHTRLIVHGHIAPNHDPRGQGHVVVIDTREDAHLPGPGMAVAGVVEDQVLYYH